MSKCLRLPFRTLLGLLLVEVGLLASCPSDAQVNIEPLRKRLTEKSWGGEGAVSLQTIGGNTRSQAYGGQLLLGGQHGRHLLLGYGSFDYAWINGETGVQRAFGHTRYDCTVRDGLWTEVFGQVEEDQFRRISSRLLAGTGPRVGGRWETSFLFVGVAYMLERTKVSGTLREGEEPTALRHRLSSYVTGGGALSEVLSWEITSYYQPRFDQLRDYRLLVEGALSVQVAPWVEARLQGDLRHESRPAPDVLADDYQLKNVLGVKF